MIILPAIDIQNGECVRLYRGDFATAHKVAEDPLETAGSFYRDGARWIHMVDLDGARTGRRENAALFLKVADQSGLQVELGGGIRDRETLDYYLSHGISLCILGSAALKDPVLVREAAAAYGERIAVGIDARDGMVAAEGWLQVSQVSYIEMAKRMEDAGVRTLIFTDIAKDGMLSGPNLEQLSALQQAVSCRIIASGGIRELKDIQALKVMGIYGVICGKSLYSGTLKLREAVAAAGEPQEKDLDRFFRKDRLIPAVIQEASTGQVLMLAYMDKTSLRRTMETGTTWFWSRSRGEYWNKGATSGHYQKVVSITGDCDDDTLLVKVDQTGAACHTGSHSCFFQPLYPEIEEEHDR